MYLDNVQGRNANSVFVVGAWQTARHHGEAVAHVIPPPPWCNDNSKNNNGGKAGASGHNGRQNFAACFILRIVTLASKQFITC